MTGHRSLAMSAIGSAADLPPLQCRRINNVEVDIKNAYQILGKTYMSVKQHTWEIRFRDLLKDLKISYSG